MTSRNLAATAVAILLAFTSAPALRAAPAELASIPVSLTVQETCLVESGEVAISAANQPTVSCLHDAPFQITQVGFDPVTPIDSTRKPAQPVEFVAARDARQTVWTVNF